MSNAFGNQGFFQSMIDQSRGKSLTPHSQRGPAIRKRANEALLKDPLYLKHANGNPGPELSAPVPLIAPGSKRSRVASIAGGILGFRKGPSSGTA